MRITSKGHELEIEFSASEYREIEEFAALEGQSIERWVGEVIKAKYQQAKKLHDRDPAPVVDIRGRHRKG